jgi:hypothetical protein
MEKNITRKKMPTGKEEASTNETNEVWTTHEKELSRSRYGCEVIQENCNKVDAKNPQLPSDAHLVSYVRGGKMSYDITRSNKMANIFDMYWDKFGDALKKIEWADGRVNPRLWGYQAPKTKKRK